VTCNTPPACRTAVGATCNSGTGACTYPAVADSTSCSDGDACNGAETCQSGSCTAGTAVTCDAPPACHTAVGATCNSGTGACTYPNLSDGTSCRDLSVRELYGRNGCDLQHASGLPHGGRRDMRSADGRLLVPDGCGQHVMQ
jgi:hypothetical protein